MQSDDWWVGTQETDVEQTSLHQQILHSWSHSYAAQKRLIKKITCMRLSRRLGGAESFSFTFVHGKQLTNLSIVYFYSFNFHDFATSTVIYTTGSHS